MRIIILLLAVLAADVYAHERVLWSQGDEISVSLGVNQERKVIFPELVRFGAKPIYADLFHHSLIEANLYITAKREFTERLVLQGIESNRFYIVNVSTTGTDSVPSSLTIHLPGKVDTDTEVKGKLAPKQIEPFELVQFASQSLYAPNKALIETLPGVRQVAVPKGEISHLYRYGQLRASVLAGWVGGGYYVTAVKLQNNTQQKIAFEPCNIRGDFFASSPQFKNIGPALSEGGPGPAYDFTIVYLLSKQPFEVASKSRAVLCK